jgi:8-oxo-dGTP diphosphatase
MKTEVKAAGGVVRRRGADGVRFAVIHRPRYDDWTLPKGKAEDGEDAEDTARREVLEETGFRCELGPPIAEVRYTDHLGRPKVVRYWLMYPAEGVFIPNEEVDDLRWITAEQARELLTYGHDRVVLDAAIGFDRPIYLVRHAKAGDRDAWTEDDRLRPLTKKGRIQAEGLVGLLADREIDRILSSPSVRCVQTVRPLALARGLAIEEVDALAEGTPAREAIELLRSTGGGVVACSHGDVIPAVVTSLERRGLEQADPPGWKKGSTWILERDGGLFTTARYLPPPGPSGSSG